MPYPIHTLLIRTAHRQQNALRPALGELGLSTGQPKVLRCLAARGPCSQRELADRCDVDPAAICRLLDGMERSGLLERCPSKADRRTGEVHLTDQGRRALQAWEERCLDFETQMLEGFSEAEKQQLRDFLERAYRNVGGRP